MSDIPERLRRTPYFLTNRERDLTISALEYVINLAGNIENADAKTVSLGTMFVGRVAKIQLMDIKKVFL